MVGEDCWMRSQMRERERADDTRGGEDGAAAAVLAAAVVPEGGMGIDDEDEEGEAISLARPASLGLTELGCKEWASEM